MNSYTVFGVYTDPLGQRFAALVEADSPESAELKARDEAEEAADLLMIAGVIEGHHQCVDNYTDGYSFGVPGLKDGRRDD